MMQYLAPQPSANIWSANLSRNEHHMFNAFPPFSISNVKSGSSLFLRKGNKTITFPRVAKKLWLKSNNWKVSLQIPRNQVVMMCSSGESSISDFRKKMGFRPNLEMMLLLMLALTMTICVACVRKRVWCGGNTDYGWASPLSLTHVCLCLSCIPWSGW